MMYESGGVYMEQTTIELCQACLDGSFSFGDMYLIGFIIGLIGCIIGFCICSYKIIERLNNIFN